MQQKEDIYRIHVRWNIGGILINTKYEPIREKNNIVDSA